LLLQLDEGGLVGHHLADGADVGAGAAIRRFDDPDTEEV
jgi:hypothetical protein